VEAIGTYSNQESLRQKWADLLKRVQGSPRRIRRDAPLPRSKRFSTAEDHVDIARKYESGDTTERIGKHYGISKTRVAAVLRERGVTIRRQALSDEQATEAVALDAAGRSLAWLGNCYSVSHTTVAAALRRYGVSIRPRPGVS
jgi:hypothetical protein